MAGFATVIKFGPFVITPSISKTQAKLLSYWQKNINN
jgi:hypothetical protein